MAKLNVAPTKSNLLSMKEQLSISQNGYELLSRKRNSYNGINAYGGEGKLLEQDIECACRKSISGIEKNAYAGCGDRVEQIANGVKYDYILKKNYYNRRNELSCN